MRQMEIQAPNKLVKTLFLAGSIEMGKAEKEFVILNLHKICGEVAEIEEDEVVEEVTPEWDF